MHRSPVVHILSDLHLVKPEEPFYRGVLRFIDEIPQPGDHLALAGDIFDVYVGNKEVFRNTHISYFQAIHRALERGVHIHHIEGNHDFWLGDSYSDLGCGAVQVNGDAIELQVENRKLRVEHGDLADTSDQFYLLLRAFFRSGLGRSWVAITPGRVLDWVGNLWSNTSRDSKLLPDDWSQEDRLRLRKIFFDYAASRLGVGKADALVMGHCHDPHECAGYMNVGFPRKHQSWVRWNPSENKLERLAWNFHSAMAP